MTRKQWTATEAAALTRRNRNVDHAELTRAIARDLSLTGDEIVELSKWFWDPDSLPCERPRPRVVKLAG